jgi:hypothetical protein
MARIRLLELHEMEPDFAEMAKEMMAGRNGEKDASAIKAFAHLPDIMRVFFDFYYKLQMEGLPSRKMVELIRLSIAQVNQCSN